MDKYRILRRHEGYVTIQSEKGKIVRIDESSFMKNFVKLKDSFISYVRKGKEVLTKIKGKVVEGVNNIYNAILNKGEDTFIYISKGSVSTCEEVGVENPNAEFNAQLGVETIEEGRQADELLVNTILDLKDGMELKNRGKIDEASKAVPGAPDEYRGMIGSRIQRPGKKEVDPELFRDNGDGVTPGVEPTKLRSQIPSVPDYTRAELFEKLDEKLESIFNREITDDSCVKYDDELYKPVMIFGAAGIGKTAIVNELKERYSKKLGVEIQMVKKVGNTLHKYSFASPAQGESTNYKLNKGGKYEFDNDGNLIDVETRKAVTTVMAADIVSFNYKDAVMRDNVKERDEACGYGIIFIDEFSRIPEPNLINSIMSFCTDRSVGEYRLGTHWAVIVATNPGSMTGKKKKGFTEADVMEDLFSDDAKNRRFDKVNFCPTLDEWLEWAKSAHVNQLIIDYLSTPQFKFHWFNSFDRIPAKDPGVTSSPALWAQCSNYLDRIIARYEREGLDATDVKTAKQFVSKIYDWFLSNMPYEGDDFTEFVKDEIMNVSKKDFKDAWLYPMDVKTKIKDSEGKTVEERKRNYLYGTNNSGLSTSSDRLAQKFYEACPIRITNFENTNEGTEFLEDMQKYFDNISEFIDYFYSRGRRTGSIPPGSGLDTPPYENVPLFEPMKKSLIKALAELFRHDLNKVFGSNETLTSIFINGVCDGKRYPVSKYFKYLLNWAI